MDFGLQVTRSLTAAGNYATDLVWTHVRNILGYCVYRSENPSDDPNDWYKINGDKIIQVNYYQDRGFVGGMPTNHERALWYYKVIPVMQDGTEYILSQSKTATFAHPLAGVQKFAAPTIRSRTNMMLDPSRFSAAEPVHFLCRKWAGAYCECIDIRTRKVDSNCPSCFPAGTLVNTYNGLRPIESIKKGDIVLSSDGSYQTVTELFSRDYSGDLVSILPSISANPILVTPEHPFLTQRGSHNKQLHCGPKCNGFIKSGDGLSIDRPDVRQVPSGNWLARGQSNGSRKNGRIALGSFKTKEEAIAAYVKHKLENYTPGHFLTWDTAENIKENNWLVSKWNSEIQDLNTISIPQQHTVPKIKNGYRRNGETTFVVDEEFLWMVGLYLAEGCAGKRTIAFCLNKKEQEYANRVISLFTKYGYTTKIRTKSDNNGMVVYVYSTTLASWFPELFGTHCYNKKIPNEFMRLPSNKIRAIIQGVYDGDNGDEHEIIQTSEYLCLQLVELLHKVGEQPLVRTQLANTLTPKGNKRRPAYVVSWAYSSSTKNNRIGRWVFNGELLTQVRSTCKKKFSGLVYNLEVSGNHTYVVNGVVVHNCFGTGFQGGFELIENVYCRVKSAPQKLVGGSGGITIQEMTSGTISTYPILSDSDVIIRKHNLRYFARDVKQRAIQGYTTAQAFNLEKVQLYDMMYRIPAPPLVEATQRVNQGAGMANVL